MQQLVESEAKSMSVVDSPKGWLVAGIHNNILNVSPYPQIILGREYRVSPFSDPLFPAGTITIYRTLTVSQKISRAVPDCEEYGWFDRVMAHRIEFIGPANVDKYASLVTGGNFRFLFSVDITAILHEFVFNCLNRILASEERPMVGLSGNAFLQGILDNKRGWIENSVTRFERRKDGEPANILARYDRELERLGSDLKYRSAILESTIDLRYLHHGEKWADGYDVGTDILRMLRCVANTTERAAIAEATEIAVSILWWKAVGETGDTTRTFTDFTDEEMQKQLDIRNELDAELENMVLATVPAPAVQE